MDYKGSDPTRRRQSHGGCMSPSFAVPAPHEVYSRINGGRGCRKQLSPSSWRRIIKKLVSDGKGLCRSKPTSFRYDAASYSKNFDDGRRSDDEFPWRHQFCRRDVRIRE